MVWEVGSFCSAVCGRCTFLAGLSFFFDVFDPLLASFFASFFNDFFGGIIGVAFGKWSAKKPPGRPRDFPTSNHREGASLRSSIAPHAARPKLADTAIRTSATRAHARIDTHSLADSPLHGFCETTRMTFPTTARQFGANTLIDRERRSKVCGDDLRHQQAVYGMK
jgi:hypothetical protein